MLIFVQYGSSTQGTQVTRFKSSLIQVDIG